MLRLRIAQQMAIGIGVLVLIPIVALNFVTRSVFERNAYARYEVDLSNTADAQLRTVDAAYQRVLSQVRSDLVFASYLLSQKGTVRLDPDEPVRLTATDQVSGEAVELDLPALVVGERAVAFDSEYVDEIQRYVGGTATIFQIVPQGMLRISTNVKKADGSRAVGTFIPTDSPVYRTVTEGQTYYGRAFVVAEWYITAYAPLYAATDELVGSLYVGVPEREYMTELLGAMSRVRIGESGYIFVVNDAGEYVLSQNHARDGEDVSDIRDADGVAIIQEMTATARSLPAGETFIARYAWLNEGESRPREKFSAVAYFEPWGWTIGASAYIDDVDRTIRDLAGGIVLVAVSASVVGVVFALLLAQFYSRPIKKLLPPLAAIANGDLTGRIDFSRHDEIGHLGNALNATVEGLSDSITSIKRAVADVDRRRDALVATSTQTAQSTKTIAETVGTVRSQAEDLGGAVDETHRAIRKISDTVGGLRMHVQDQAAAVEESSASVEQMIASIQSVTQIADKKKTVVDELVRTAEAGRTEMEAVSRLAANLAESIREVSSVSSVINNIGARTNILSMNAAIEAAHAGDAGRGFAVVAEEIRRLADASGRNAKTISGIVESVVSEIGRMKESTDTATEVLTRVGKTTEESSSAFAEIARGMAELSLGAGQILDSVKRLRETTVSLGTVSEEVADGTEAINGTADRTRTVSNTAVIAMQESQRGTEEISSAITDLDGAVTDISAQINAVREVVDRFRTDHQKVS